MRHMMSLTTLLMRRVQAALLPDRYLLITLQAFRHLLGYLLLWPEQLLAQWCQRLRVLAPRARCRLALQRVGF